MDEALEMLKENEKTLSREKTESEIYLEEHGLPKHLAIFINGKDVSIGEWVADVAFRNLLEACKAYGEYSVAVAKDLVRASYDDRVQQMYIAMVSSALQANVPVVPFDDFCNLAIPNKILEERDIALGEE